MELSYIHIHVHTCINIDIVRQIIPFHPMARRTHEVCEHPQVQHAGISGDVGSWEIRRDDLEQRKEMKKKKKKKKREVDILRIVLHLFHILRPFLSVNRYMEKD